MNEHCSENDDVDSLVDRAAHGDSQAMAVLLDRYRKRLERMVGLRLDRRLRGRVGASDIVQEAIIEASRRLSENTLASAGRDRKIILWDTETGDQRFTIYGHGA